MMSPFTCETKKEFDQLIVTGLYTTKEIEHRTSYHTDGMACSARMWSACKAVLTPFSLSGHRQMSLGNSQCNLCADCVFLCQLEENSSGDNTNHSNTQVRCMLSNPASQNNVLILQLRNVLNKHPAHRKEWNKINQL